MILSTEKLQSKLVDSQKMKQNKNKTQLPVLNKVKKIGIKHDNIVC